MDKEETKGLIMNNITLLKRKITTIWVVFIFLWIVFFTLIQLQFKGAEKRIIFIESIDYSHIHDCAPLEHEHEYKPQHTHRYFDGAAVYN